MFEGYFPKFAFDGDSDNQRKGDGIVMACNGQYMIVDAFEGNESTDAIRTWLNGKGTDTIDIAVLTHPHWDHYNGMLELLDAGIKIKLLLCYDPLTLEHGCDGSENGKSVREDMDNAYKVVRRVQAAGGIVRWVGIGRTIKFGDISWKVWRKQPTEFTEYDDGNAWAFINDGSLILYSPEIQLLLGGDGPCDIKEALAYFDAPVSGYDIAHHGNNCSQSNAAALKKYGCVLAWESCVERDGAGTTDWTAYGARRVVQQGIPVWMQDQDIRISAAGGYITFTQGSKVITKAVPYSGTAQTGWVKDSKGWYYRRSDGSCVYGWAKLAWSKGEDWFYFDSNAYMVTGWQYLKWSQGNNWFYFDPSSGAMRTGWVYADGDWYCLDEKTGAMLTGWVEYKGHQCYLEPVSGKNQGHCYRNCTATIDGTTYKFDKDGYATEITGDAGPLNGVDIASYQAGIDFTAMSTTDFAIIKMTQGTDYINPYAEDQYSGAKAAGKLLGAYHYAEGTNAVSEASYFLKKLGSRVGECIIALDWEGKGNPLFGTGKDPAWCKAWLDEVYKQTGVRGFVYMSKDNGCRAHDWSSVAADYPLWGAQYANNNQTDYQTDPWTDSNPWGAWGSPVIHQYSSHGDIEGYNKNIDIDLAYMGRAQWLAYASGSSIPATTESSRDRIVALAKSMVGIKEGSAEHHAIIDTYNAYGAAHGYPRGYKVTYTDAWCATFISALAIKCGLESIIPIECGCPQMITIAQSMGEWVENDAYVPQVGDIVLYDWQDSGSGDNTGTPDHIGICTEVSGNALKVTEGNYNDAVGVRSLTVNGKTIRGYIVPKY